MSFGAAMTNAARIDEAYAYCRNVARREAKNFYYAFRVLPKAKSDAMCAVYAFMRKADDISDDESINVDERRVMMQRWLAEWRGSRSETDPEDSVFRALGDAQRRFGIPDELLEDLVRGTTMDLAPLSEASDGRVDLGGGFQGYRTFADLYRYCYLVASVVGLVCIRIFGYSDPAAEVLAEKTGVAFQLTNILRDVQEDAERKRIYLPQDLLEEFGVLNGDLLELAAGRPMKPRERAMLIGLSVQAWEYYEAAQALLPMIDADSRAALWVLVEIYSGLLKKIDERDGDVFSERVSVPAASKVLALVRGAAMSLRTRKA
jgi:phytoene synthase